MRQQQLVRRFVLAFLATALAISTVATSGEDSVHKHSGKPELKSIGQLAFGPDGVLFLGDSIGARLFAVDLGEAPRDGDSSPIQVKDLDAKIAALLGTKVSDVHVGDMAVHPVSQHVYLSVTRGNGQRGWGRVRGDNTTPVLVRVTKDGGIEEVILDDVRYSQVVVVPAPSSGETTRRGLPRRTFTIMDMAYIDGYVYLSGLSNEEFSSRLRRIAYPFAADMSSNSIEIFHTAHGRYETHAPINTFAPYRDGKDTKILGAFSCTPLVTFPLDQEDGAHVKGTTVAELGAGNHPLDIISYDRDDETHFLLANHLHPFMRIERSEIVRARGLTRPSGRAGARVKTLPQQGIIRLDDLNPRYVTALQRGEDGSPLHLISLAKDSM